MRKKKAFELTAEQMEVVSELASRYVKVICLREDYTMYFYHFGKSMITDRMQTFVNSIFANFKKEVDSKDLFVKVNHDWTTVLVAISKAFHERLDTNPNAKRLFDEARTEYDRVCEKIIAEVGVSTFQNMKTEELSRRITDIVTEEKLKEALGIKDDKK